jgi:quercetin dioxygenase-like cupin family protein
MKSEQNIAVHSAAAAVPANGAAPASAELRQEIIDAAERLRDRIAGQTLNIQEALRLRDLLENRMLSPSPNPRREGFLWPDGSLRLARWAEAVSDHELRVSTDERPHAMEAVKATGEGLISNGHLGADIIRCAAGGGFAPHTHIGDHLLFVVAGEGTITYNGRIYPTHPGQVYFVEGAVPHAVGAITEHVLISVGSPHRAVNAPDRQTLKEYDSILADFAYLHCDICDLEAEFPTRLADLGCPHCPSQFC